MSDGQREYHQRQEAGDNLIQDTSDHHYGDPLLVEIRDGRLSITIGIETLARAVELQPTDDPLPQVNYPNMLAVDVVAALADEAEDGTTLVHRMLDQGGSSIRKWIANLCLQGRIPAMTNATFTDWCAGAGCRNSLFIRETDLAKTPASWAKKPLWNGVDTHGTFFTEFGFYLEGLHTPAVASQAGLNPFLFSQGTAASSHETAQMAQPVLAWIHHRNPIFFGLSPDYVFTLQDGQRAVTLEDPKTPGICVWDGLIRAELIKGSPTPAPAPAPPPAPVPTPPPSPTPPPANGLPALTLAVARVRELEVTVQAFAMLLVPSLFQYPQMGMALSLGIVALRPLSVGLLVTFRRARKMSGDPRPLPPGEGA